MFQLSLKERQKKLKTLFLPRPLAWFIRNRKSFTESSSKGTNMNMSVRRCAHAIKLKLIFLDFCLLPGFCLLFDRKHFLLLFTLLLSSLKELTETIIHANIMRPSADPDTRKSINFMSDTLLKIVSRTWRRFTHQAWATIPAQPWTFDSRNLVLRQRKN